MDVMDARKSVELLLTLAFSHSGSAGVAAQVLMAAYDGSRYHLCIRDLCMLDQAHFTAALNVIRLRAWDGIEPHEVIADAEQFPRLCQRWGEQLNIVSRGQQ